MKKTLNKSCDSNQLGTYFELYASCSCGVCGCSCNYSWEAVNPNVNITVIEAGYRSALEAHT